MDAVWRSICGKYAGGARPLLRLGQQRGSWVCHGAGATGIGWRFYADDHAGARRRAYQNWLGRVVHVHAIREALAA